MNAVKMNLWQDDSILYLLEREPWKEKKFWLRKFAKWLRQLFLWHDVLVLRQYFPPENWRKREVCKFINLSKDLYLHYICPRGIEQCTVKSPLAVWVIFFHTGISPPSQQPETDNVIGAFQQCFQITAVVTIYIFSWLLFDDKIMTQFAQLCVGMCIYIQPGSGKQFNTY